MSSNLRLQRICQQCETEFTAKTTVTKFCGLTCAQRNYKARLRKTSVALSDAQTVSVRIKPLSLLQAKDFLSIEETGLLLGLSQSTVLRLLKHGRIPATKFGRRTIIRRKQLDALFQVKTDADS